MTVFEEIQIKVYEHTHNVEAPTVVVLDHYTFDELRAETATYLLASDPQCRVMGMRIALVMYEENTPRIIKVA